MKLPGNMAVSAQTVTVLSGGTLRIIVSDSVSGTSTKMKVVSVKPSVSVTTRQIVSITPSSEDVV